MKNPIKRHETEAEFQSAVVDLAHQRHWLIHHCRPCLNERGKYQTAIQGDKGFVDLVMARRGRIIFWELKTDSKRSTTTPDQDRWLTELTMIGDRCPDVDARVMRPSDWEQIVKELM